LRTIRIWEAKEEETQKESVHEWYIERDEPGWRSEGRREDLERK